MRMHIFGEALVFRIALIVVGRNRNKTRVDLKAAFRVEDKEPFAIGTQAMPRRKDHVRIEGNGRRIDPDIAIQTQRDAAGPALITQISRSGRADGTSTVGGVTWSRWVSADDRTRTLSRVDGSVTIVVSADLSYQGLEAFASTLRSS